MVTPSYPSCVRSRLPYIDDVDRRPGVLAAARERAQLARLREPRTPRHGAGRRVVAMGQDLDRSEPKRLCRPLAQEGHGTAGDAAAARLHGDPVADLAVGRPPGELHQAERPGEAPVELGEQRHSLAGPRLRGAAGQPRLSMLAPVGRGDQRPARDLQVLAGRGHGVRIVGTRRPQREVAVAQRGWLDGRHAAKCRARTGSGTVLARAARGSCSVVSACAAVARALLWISAALIVWTQAGYAVLLALRRPRGRRAPTSSWSCRAAARCVRRTPGCAPRAASCWPSATPTRCGSRAPCGRSRRRSRTRPSATPAGGWRSSTTAARTRRASTGATRCGCAAGSRRWPRSPPATARSTPSGPRPTSRSTR